MMNGTQSLGDAWKYVFLYNFWGTLIPKKTATNDFWLGFQVQHRYLFMGACSQPEQYESKLYKWDGAWAVFGLAGQVTPIGLRSQCRGN